PGLGGVVQGVHPAGESTDRGFGLKKLDSRRIATKGALVPHDRIRLPLKPRPLTRSQPVKSYPHAKVCRGCRVRSRSSFCTLRTLLKLVVVRTPMDRASHDIQWRYHTRSLDRRAAARTEGSSGRGLSPSSS